MPGRGAIPQLQNGATSQFLLGDLDKKTPAILKGLAIFAIVFHNFFSCNRPGARETNSLLILQGSRFSCKRSPIRRWRSSLCSRSTAISEVQVFIFLSAYGLAKSHWNDSASWSSFMWSRGEESFTPMFGLAVLFWAVLAAIHVGPIWVIRNTGPGLRSCYARRSIQYSPWLGTSDCGAVVVSPLHRAFLCNVLANAARIDQQVQLARACGPFHRLFFLLTLAPLIRSLAHSNDQAWRQPRSGRMRGALPRYHLRLDASDPASIAPPRNPCVRDHHRQKRIPDIPRILFLWQRSS